MQTNFNTPPPQHGFTPLVKAKLTARQTMALIKNNIFFKIHTGIMNDFMQDFFWNVPSYMYHSQLALAALFDGKFEVSVWAPVREPMRDVLLASARAPFGPVTSYAKHQKSLMASFVSDSSDHDERAMPCNWVRTRPTCMCNLKYHHS